MKAHIVESPPGEFKVFVGDELIQTKKTEQEAQELVDALALPGTWLDNAPQD